jgi:quercetin dioxygenase-like cupin family protein
MKNESNLFIKNENIEWEVIGKGLKRKILGYDKRIMSVIVDFEKDSVGALHSHEHSQSSYIISGSFEVQIDEKKSILKAGDAFFVPSNIKHGVLALEKSSLIDSFSPMREDFLRN